MLSLALVGTDETGLRPDGSTVNPELTCQRVHADALRAGCSHGVHFAVREACSRSFTGSSDIRWGSWGEAAGGEEHAEAVVVAVAVAAGEAAMELDDPVHRLGAAVR